VSTQACKSNGKKNNFEPILHLPNKLFAQKYPKNMAQISFNLLLHQFLISRLVKIFCPAPIFNAIIYNS
jgi:hypothetical protein